MKQAHCHGLESNDTFSRLLKSFVVFGKNVNLLRSKYSSCSFSVVVNRFPDSSSIRLRLMWNFFNFVSGSKRSSSNAVSSLSVRTKKSKFVRKSNACGWIVTKLFLLRKSFRNFPEAVPNISPLNDFNELPDKSKLSNFARRANVFGWMFEISLLFSKSFRSEFRPFTVNSSMLFMLFPDKSRNCTYLRFSNAFEKILEMSLLLKSSSRRRTLENPRNRWFGRVCMLFPDKFNRWIFCRPFKQLFSRSFIEFCDRVSVWSALKLLNPSDGNWNLEIS